MERKGQIAIFVLLGVMLLIGIVVFLMLTKQPTIEVAKYATDEDRIKGLIESCVLTEVHDAVERLAENGGTFEPAAKHVLFEGKTIAYHFPVNTYTSTTEEEVRKDLHAIILGNYLRCLREIAAQEPDMSFDSSFPEIQLEMHSGIDVTIRHTISIVTRSEGTTSSKKIDELHFQLPVRLGLLLETINAVLREQEPGMPTLTGFALPDGMTLSSDSHQEGTIFTLTDNQSSSGNEPFAFWFFSPWNRPNDVVQINEIPLIVGIAGDPFHYVFTANQTASGELLWTLDNNVLDIDGRTGIVDFIPDDEDAGIYLLRVKAINTETLASDEQYFTTIILKENAPPQLKTPELFLQGNLDEELTHTIVASDPDSDPLTYTLLEGIGGSVSEGGIFSFTPSAVGTEDFLIAVSDGTNYVVQKIEVVTG